MKDLAHVLASEALVARGAALLAFAGPPSPSELKTMVVCAENLNRDLVVATVGTRPGGVIATAQELAHVATAVRRIAAAIVIVAGTASPDVVRRLAAATRRPVLVARTRQPWQVVLAATDGLTRALPVVEVAATIAATRRACSVVLHNVVPAWASPSGLVDGSGAFVTGVARRLRRLARTAARTSPRSSVVVCSTRSSDRAIVDATIHRDADLVVIGMRRPAPGRSGRCADHVMTAAPSNVLVVPLGPRRERGRRGLRS